MTAPLAAVDQHIVDRRAETVAGDQDGNLLARQTSLGGSAAALADGLPKDLLPLEGRQHVGLVNLCESGFRIIYLISEISCLRYC